MHTSPTSRCFVPYNIHINTSLWHRADYIINTDTKKTKKVLISHDNETQCCERTRGIIQRIQYQFLSSFVSITLCDVKYIYINIPYKYTEIQPLNELY